MNCSDVVDRLVILSWMVFLKVLHKEAYILKVPDGASLKQY